MGKKRPWDQIYEWHANFSRNNIKKNQNFKKKIPSFYELIEISRNFEWMAYELFLVNRKEVVFLLLLRGKKTNFGFLMKEWQMNFSQEKKSVTLAGD